MTTSSDFTLTNSVHILVAAECAIAVAITLED
jgi:hypothetical protein